MSYVCPPGPHGADRKSRWATAGSRPLIDAQKTVAETQPGQHCDQEVGPRAAVCTARRRPTNPVEPPLGIGRQSMAGKRSWKHSLETGRVVGVLSKSYTGQRGRPGNGPDFMSVFRPGNCDRFATQEAHEIQGTANANSKNGCASMPILRSKDCDRFSDQESRPTHVTGGWGVCTNRTTEFHAGRRTH